MVPEFQCVILAAGAGSRMYPLTEEIPKALLPVGNFPLIWYPIHQLQKYGFDEFIIVVLESKENMFSQALKMCCDFKVKFKFVTIPDGEDSGTVGTLKYLKDIIKTDVIIISCDLITDAPFHRLADIHRTHDATLTALIAPRLELQQEREIMQSGKVTTKDADQGQKDFISIDESENRLLFMLNEAEADGDVISVRKSLLKRYPYMKIQNDLVDSHMYIMKKWLIDFFADRGSFESLKADAVPFIINKQFSTSLSKCGGQDLDTSLQSPKKEGGKPELIDYVNEDDVRSSVRDWSVNWDADKRLASKNLIRCHAYVTEGTTCIRVNNLPAYTYINREITKSIPIIFPNLEFAKIHTTVQIKEKSQIGTDCMVGECVNVSDNVSVKKSTIGKHCKIGSKVKISNSVIMEYVTIGDRCNIQGSIICNYAHVKEGCTIKDCQVGANHTVKADHNRELLVNEFMDLDD